MKCRCSRRYREDSDDPDYCLGRNAIKTMSDSFQSFSLSMSRPRSFFILGSLMLTGLLGCFLLAGIVFPWMNRPRWALGLILLIACGYEWYRLLSTASCVRLFEDGKIEFISVFKTWRLSVYALTSIEPQRRSNFYLLVRHQEGEIRLFNRVEGLREFLERLKSLNQAVEVKGVEFNRT